MKKVFYSLCALILLWATKTTAQDANPCLGKANFQFTINGYTVNFYSLTTNNTPLRHSWRFGDGGSSDGANPVHTYGVPGLYRVVHYIKDEARNCYDSAVKEIRVGSICDLLQPKYEWKRDSLNPARIHFINTSLPNAPPTTLLYKWNFGDGTTSTEKNPSHLFTTPGQYNVCLTIRYANENCEKTFCSIVTVPQPCDFQPYFTWAVDPSNLLTVKFTNQTLVNVANAQAKWSFGDGFLSNDWNAVHTYTQPGVYKVCLKVYINNTCVREICKEVVVRGCNIEPKFVWTVDSFNLLKIKFTNQTITPTANAQAKWSFGDGTYSTDWNVIHTYTQAGIYTVCLKVYIGNDCIKEICKQVVVRGCTIEPNFSWTLDSIYPFRGVQFKNLTPATILQPLGVKWSFGDGTGSNEWNSFHKYEKAGTYRVCLKIEFFSGCVKEICKTVVVPEPVNCERLSEFKFASTSEINTYKFEASFVNSSLKYVWTFGDGTGAFDAVTKHKYDRPGRYTVCLTVYRSENCASTSCKEIVVGPLPCELTRVKFEYVRLNTAGNIIKFTAVSNQPLFSQRWTIQKDNAPSPVILNTSNPTYTFTSPGIYKVCLRAITANGCVKEYCEVITIANTIPACLLQVTPNPATTQIYFRLQLEKQQTVVASIIDLNGVRRSVHFLSAAAGWNSFSISVATLPVGYYTLEVKYNDRVCTSRFQKIN